MRKKLKLSEEKAEVLRAAVTEAIASSTPEGVGCTIQKSVQQDSRSDYYFLTVRVSFPGSKAKLVRVGRKTLNAGAVEIQAVGEFWFPLNRESFMGLLEPAEATEDEAETL